MKRSLAVMAAVVTVIGALPAYAQTSTPSTPAVNMVNVGIFGGASAVENVGGLVGAEGAWRLPGSGSFDLIVEGGWAQDAVTRRRSTSTKPLTDYLTARHGSTATATVEAPTFFGLAGFRWVFERSGAIRPYLQATAGMASVEYKTSFTLGSTDITGSLAQYGVTLGQDLRGREKKAAFGGGAGVLYVKDKWYVDAGVRVTSIQTSGQATTLTRGQVGFGLRF